MLIKANIDPDTLKEIQFLIEQGKYSDILQFLSVAISNQIQEESYARNQLSHAEDLKKSSIQLSEKPKALSSGMETETIHYSELNWQNYINALELEPSEIQPEYSDLIYYFYNRFFPVKVVVRELAKMMAVNQRTWIELGDIQVKAFEVAESLATRLKDFESSGKIPRNKKLSTGLPSSRKELAGMRGMLRRKKEEKMQRGKTRFMDQIVGKNIGDETKKFSGATFELGLMGVKINSQSYHVSLTESGRKFALIKNPILDKEVFDRAFSNDEIFFILHEIYPRFELENKIIKQIVKLLETSSLGSADLDKLFKDENRKYYKQERIGTMGRLSELQIVNWDIDRDGKSNYSLNEEKVKLLN